MNMSMVAFYGRVFADIDQQRLHGIIRAAAANLPARAEWKECGTIVGWIKLLESYKRDSKFKWSKFKHLKLQGFKIGMDQKQSTPDLYEASIHLFNLVDFTGNDIGIPPKMCKKAVKFLVHFLKHLTQLVKDFRSFYNPAKCPAKLMDRLAKRNPKVFSIWQAGTDRMGHSSTIVIENLLTSTEVDESCNVAKLAVATKVLEYMLQLSKIVDLIPAKKDKRARVVLAFMPTRVRLYEELVEVLSLQSEDSERDPSISELDFATREFMIKNW